MYYNKAALKIIIQKDIQYLAVENSCGNATCRNVHRVVTSTITMRSAKKIVTINIITNSDERSIIIIFIVLIIAVKKFT